MLNKTLFLALILVTGCGKDVSIPNDLERVSNITQAETKNGVLEGVIVKGSSIQVKVDGKTYVLSKFSSHGAQTFVNSLPAGETPVKFRGEIKTTEVVISKFY